jgi:hypothetical protein
MPFESITDIKIEELLSMTKTISNARSKSKEMEDDFSCGISWLSSNGDVFTLKRYNGPSHIHRNPLEKTFINQKQPIKTKVTLTQPK